jgi:hypothetical protein
MQRFEVEDEVQLAYVFEETVEGLDEDLYQIEESEWRFGRGGDDDEVQCCIVAVGDKGRGVVVGRGRRRRLAAVCEQGRETGEVSNMYSWAYSQCIFTARNCRLSWGG